MNKNAGVDEEYLRARGVQKTLVGTGTKSPSSNDAKLGIELGHTLDQHFINAWDAAKNLGISHLNDAAGAGRDYLGTTQEFPV